MEPRTHVPPAPARGRRTHILMFSWYCRVSEGWLYSGCGERGGSSGPARRRSHHPTSARSQRSRARPSARGPDTWEPSVRWCENRLPAGVTGNTGAQLVAPAGTDRDPRGSGGTVTSCQGTAATLRAPGCAGPSTRDKLSSQGAGIGNDLQTGKLLNFPAPEPRRAPRQPPRTRAKPPSPGTGSGPWTRVTGFGEP